jgi:hypothetical protein
MAGILRAVSGMLGDEVAKGIWIGPHKLVHFLALLDEEECRHSTVFYHKHRITY